MRPLSRSLAATAIIVLLAAWLGCSEDSGVTDLGGGGNPPLDTIAPVVALTSPQDGATIPAQLQISGTATDASSGVAFAQFRITTLCDAVIITVNDSTPPYETSWDASGLASGEYRICMAATDSAGHASDWVCVTGKKGVSSYQIAGFSPPGAGTGTKVKALGDFFGTDNGNGRVRVGGVDAVIESWSNEEVEFTVPSGIMEDAMVGVEIVIDCRLRATGQLDIPPANVIRITDSNAMDEQPCWGGGDNWIYFSSTRSGNWDIWRIPARGGEAQQVTHDPGPDFWADVKPSDGKLAWMTTRDHLGYNPDGDYEIMEGYLPCGTACTWGLVTTDTVKSRMPAWAIQLHGGYNLTFTNDLIDDRGYAIPTVMLHSEIGGIEEFTEGENSNFSYDGRWIVYQKDYNIYKIAIDGGDPIQLTTHGNDFFPHWGWANDMIVFQRSSSGFYAIFKMNPDGTDQQPVLEHRYHEYSPSWSSDCTKIVYCAHRWSNFDIYMYEVP